jgi:peptidoglycan/xylan/chitin deacetylase (PgdA/CDA1 family)
MARRGTILRSWVAMLTIGVMISSTMVRPALAAGWPQPAAGHSSSKGPEILFTFDDGPNPRTTPLVLDILKAHHIKAVFFIVGEMVKNNKKGQALIKRIEAEGHIIANHTMKHKDLCRVKEDAAIRDLDDGQQAVQEATSLPVVWFRAPFGARCKRLEDMMAERHIHHFHWDLDPQEWKHKSADKAYDYVVGELGHSSDRNVLLMHDIHQATVDALPRILEWIDNENVSRAAIGKKPIRIVQSWEIATEKLAKGVWPWLTDVASASDIRTLAASVLP